MNRIAKSRAAKLVLAFLTIAALPPLSQLLAARLPATVVSLDGPGWLLATDPQNLGRAQQWWKKPTTDAKSTKVPWIIQDVFPDYHGVAWYWRYFEAPVNPHQHGRHLLRFWAVDYQAEVWVNGTPVGSHEGGETPFVLDVTRAIKTGARNLVAVRVLNPADEPIEGLTLKQTPHRNKTCAFTCGCDYNHGGIEDSVELLVTPAVRIEDLFVRAEPKTGIVSLQVNVRNTLPKSVKGKVELTLSPSPSGETLASGLVESPFKPGDTMIKANLKVENPRLWELNDPFLYRVTARIETKNSASFDEQTTRCGFRDFRLDNGYFRLNGRRMFLRSSVSGNMSPIGIHVPADPDWLRRDLFNVKAMGFNTIRFYGLPTRRQLDLSDELGLLVYEEPFSSQLYEDSPQMAERFDRSTAEMIRRDRNHPSVVIWGLLNETADTPQFRHAVKTLALVRSLDESRVVLLGSGRFDLQLAIGSIANPGSRRWEFLLGGEQENAPATKSSEHLGYFVPAYIQQVGDAHAYPWVPHTAKDIHFLRTLGQHTKPVFLSEHGTASAVDLLRVVRHYEQRNKSASGEGRFYRQALDQFMLDWERWRMAECFGRPEDYFAQCLAANARQRLIGLNAIRANPRLVGYSLTGTVDQGYTGEGLTTVFRELKPGIVDAMFDGLAPLRWCLFVEPVNVYRGAPLKLEAVLANEDVLAAGQYPVRFEVFGPDEKRVLDRTMSLAITDPHAQPPPPLVVPVFSQDARADWPAGKYRFVATFERGAAPAGGTAEFYILDPAGMPRVETPVVLWGNDEALGQWLAQRHIRVSRFQAAEQTARELILVGNEIPPPGGAEAFKELARRIMRGSTAVFLDPTVFAIGGQPANLALIGGQGTLLHLPNNVYHKDDWAKRHPLFEGLPSGGLMDYTFYREVISNLGWSRPDAPAEAVAGAIYAFTAYSSGLLLSVDQLGAGRVVLNTLRIRENLGKSPAADWLLLNILRYAAPDSAKTLDLLPSDFEARFQTER